MGKVRQLKCHRCGSADLVLHETRFEHAEYDGGLFVNENGHIEARGIAYFEAGEIQPSLTLIDCATCGHEWHPRRSIDGVEEG